MKPFTFSNAKSLVLNLLIIFLSTLSFSSFAHEHEKEVKKQKPVLVTGASSGLGFRK